jgi:hypothetical protein
MTFGSFGKSIVLFVRHYKHADAPNAPPLLRACRAPLGCGADEKRYERATFDCPRTSLFPTGRIAHLSYGLKLLRCGISSHHDC